MSSVSVVVPSYNQGTYIINCLNSIIAQTKKPFEIIVADDHSTDNTEKIIKSYLKKSNKAATLVKFIRHKKNLGSYNFTYNTGVKNAKGDYIIIVSADDWLDTTILELESKVLDKYPRVAMVYSQSISVIGGEKILTVHKPAGKNSYVARANDFELLLTNGDFIPSINALVRKKVYQKVGLFDTNLRYMADYEMWIRIAQNYPLAYLAKPLTFYRVHGKNMHLNADFLKRNEFEFKYILKKYLSNKNLDEPLAKIKRNAFYNYYLAIAANEIFRNNLKKATIFWWKALKLKPFYIVSWPSLQPFYFLLREFFKKFLFRSPKNSDTNHN